MPYQPTSTELINARNATTALYIVPAGKIMICTHASAYYGGLTVSFVNLYQGLTGVTCWQVGLDSVNTPFAKMPDGTRIIIQAGNGLEMAATAGVDMYASGYIIDA
jgi:hypothetical protein